MVTISYDDGLRDVIAERLTRHDRRTVTDPSKRHAAVAVVLVDSLAGEDRVDPAPVDDWIAGRPMPGDLDGRMVDVSGGAAFFLCRRASRLSSHSAQWALPGASSIRGVGGRCRAAELDEEVGVRLPDSAVLGLLDDYPTRSGYVITPVVVWGGGRLDPRPSPTRWSRSIGWVCTSFCAKIHRASSPSPRARARWCRSRWATT